MNLLEVQNEVLRQAVGQLDGQWVEHLYKLLKVEGAAASHEAELLQHGGQRPVLQPPNARDDQRVVGLLVAVLGSEEGEICALQ